LEVIGLALAGRAGARLADKLGMVIGRDSLLRLVRALPDPPIGRPICERRIDPAPPVSLPQGVPLGSARKAYRIYADRLTAAAILTDPAL
jgi:hypothetical protein